MEEEAKKEGCEPQERDICFIITPIGEDGSAIRKKTEGILKNVIKPVCSNTNLHAIVAHEIDEPGSITNQVIQHVLESKMVIANLTGLNPNVMYELAIRHASRKPVICIAEENTKLPFDITTERTIFYTDDMYGAVNLQTQLYAKIQAALEGAVVDNPIYRAITDSIIKGIHFSHKNEDSDTLLYILQRLDNIESTLNRNSRSDFNKITTNYPSGNSIKWININLSGFAFQCKSDVENFLKKYIIFIDINSDLYSIFIMTTDKIPLSCYDELNQLLSEKYDIEITDVRVNDKVVFKSTSCK